MNRTGVAQSDWKAFIDRKFVRVITCRRSYVVLEAHRSVDLTYRGLLEILC